MKFVFWGLGSVGRSFLSKLKEHGLFNPASFYLVDSSEEAKQYFVSEGGKPENVSVENINICIPKWVSVLKSDNEIKNHFLNKAKESIIDVNKLRVVEKINLDLEDSKEIASSD